MGVKFSGKIRKRGNDFWITIPKEIYFEEGLTSGQQIEFTISPAK